MTNKKKYNFTQVKENYEDYASGRVLYGAPNATNFPVRLSSEVFQRCKDYLEKNGNKGPYIIWDPFCGVSYSLTVNGFLHGNNIKKIYASDVDKNMLEFSQKNLSLLSLKGIDKRIIELEKFLKDYKKDSHKEAIESAKRLKLKIKDLNIKIEIFNKNILLDNLDINKIDIVIADVPYGKLTTWDGQQDEINSIQITLNKIKKTLNKVSVVCIILNKKQEILFDGYSKISKFNLGKRKVILLKPEF